MSTLRDSGSTWAWRKIRAAVLDRDQWTCHWCSKPAATVDHVIARMDGGSDDPSNLVACCSRCNIVRGQAAKKGAPPPSRGW